MIDPYFNIICSGDNIVGRITLSSILSQGLCVGEDPATKMLRGEILFGISLAFLVILTVVYFVRRIQNKTEENKVVPNTVLETNTESNIALETRTPVDPLPVHLEESPTDSSN